MPTDVKNVALGIVGALVSVMVGYILFNSLFGPTNTAMTTLCATMSAAGYTTEADLVEQSWNMYLLAIPVALLLGSLVLIYKGFKG